MNLTQVNNSGSCEPLGDFNLNVKWRNHGNIGCFLLQKMIPNLNYFENK